ncbi:MAG: hypothetical protein C4327_02730 [Meiothermus sp.]
MRTRWLFPLWVALGLAFAQSVRIQGMGGLVLPGPEAAFYNPAYAAYPNPYGDSEGLRLPLGLLRLVLPLFPDTNALGYFTDRQTFKTRFDALSLYDQLTHLDSFLFNPARSPDEVVFTVGNNQLSVTDGQGQPLNLDFSLGGGGQTSSSLLPPALFRLPLEVGVPGLRLELSALYGSGGFSLEASPELRQAVQGNLSPCKSATPSPCSLTGRTSFMNGLGLSLSYATALPSIPAFEGQLYAGVRGEGFYGLGYLEAQASARPTFDSNGNLSGSEYQVRYFYTYPSAGSGYGLRGDVGLVLDYAGFTLGLGLQNLVGFVRWSGTEVNVVNGSSTQTPSTRESGGFRPAVFVNGAYRMPLELGSLLVGADFNSAAQSAHLGLEYALDFYRLRAGIGLEGGFQFGLGGGVRLPGFSLDAALTAHPAPIVPGTVYGLALSLGF